MSKRIKKPRRESSLQTKAIALLRSRGKYWFVEKRHAMGMGVAGLPDLSCSCHGLSAQLELKAPGNKPTELQAYWLKKLSEAGAIAMWADSLEGVERFAWCAEARAYELGLGPAPGFTGGAEALPEGVSASIDSALAARHTPTKER